MKPLMSQPPERLRSIVFHIDGLRYAIGMTRVIAARLVTELREAGRRTAEQNPSEEVILALLADSWAIIDMVHRARELIQGTPTVPCRQPGFQLFLRATAGAEQLRHHVQHMRGVIPSMKGPCAPLWGSVSWRSCDDHGVCYTLLTGSLEDGVNIQSLAMDTTVGSFPDRVELAAGGVCLDIWDLVARMEGLRQALHDWIDAHSSFHRVEAVTPIMTFHLFANPDPP